METNKNNVRLKPPITKKQAQETKQACDDLQESLLTLASKAEGVRERFKGVKVLGRIELVSDYFIAMLKLEAEHFRLMGQIQLDTIKDYEQSNRLLREREREIEDVAGYDYDRLNMEAPPFALDHNPEGYVDSPFPDEATQNAYRFQLEAGLLLPKKRKGRSDA